MTIRTRWGGFTLTQQFVIMGGLVVAAGMVIIGYWVARQIEDGVTRNAAAATVLYVDCFISPLTRELQTADTLSIGPVRALDEIFKDVRLATDWFRSRYGNLTDLLSTAVIMT